MITIKSQREIELLRKSGNLVYKTLEYLKDFIKPGISTFELDQLAYNFIINNNATN